MKSLAETSKRKYLSFTNISIQYRLPLLIFILLLFTVLIFSWISFIGVQTASLQVGKERLSALSGQLSSMFQQSVSNALTPVRKIADKEDLKAYVETNDPSLYAKALEELRQAREADTLSGAVQLVNSAKQIVLTYGDRRIEEKSKSDLKEFLQGNIKSINAGKFMVTGDSIYYPIAAPIIDRNKLVGYIVKWKILKSSKKSIGQLAQLLGANGKLYFGNDDGKFWTDLITPVAGPPVSVSQLKGVAEYTRKGGEPLIATIRQVPQSHWLVLVELSKSALLATSKIFLRWLLIIGVIFIIAGSVLAWLISRTIVIPLVALKNAAIGIAGGNYSSLVPVGSRDELGELASSFNTMVARVGFSQAELEQKVKERTFELELANKELEAFSYSVSHDLRTPLRAIDGYAMILKEDFGDKLGPEGNRVIQVIMTNAKQMGGLIDDLLAFSRLGKKEIAFNDVDMKALVDESIEALFENGLSKYVVKYGDLPECKGDQAMLKQVWMNLISNAIKYSSKKESPVIEIGSINTGNGVTYFVKDNGVGFDMQYSGKLFGVFQRLHGQNEFEGTGVGLALVKRIVEKHAGTVTAEAYPGEGATFYFTIPN